jgi:hypothetical protein
MSKIGTQANFGRGFGAATPGSKIAGPAAVVPSITFSLQAVSTTHVCPLTPNGTMTLYPPWDWCSRHEDRACNAHEGVRMCTSGLAARIGEHVAGGLENDCRVGCNRASGTHGKFNAKGDERIGFGTGDKEGNREE